MYEYDVAFCFEYEYDAKVDGHEGRFMSREFVTPNDYDDVNNMIKFVTKVMTKKEGASVTFRCVKYDPIFEDKPMYKIENDLTPEGYIPKGIKWEEGKETPEEFQIELNAKSIKKIVLDSISEYDTREEEEREKSRYY